MPRITDELYKRIEIQGETEITLKNGVKVCISKSGVVYIMQSDMILGRVKAYTDLADISVDLVKLNNGEKIY